MTNAVIDHITSRDAKRKNPTLEVRAVLNLSEVFSLSTGFLERLRLSSNQGNRLKAVPDPGQAMNMAAFLLREGTLKEHWQRGVELAIEAVHRAGPFQESFIIDAGLEIIPVIRERLEIKTALNLLVNMGVSNHTAYDERIVSAWEAFVRQTSGGNKEFFHTLVSLSASDLNIGRRANPLVRRAEAMLEELSAARS